jgi:hypothetical protein
VNHPLKPELETLKHLALICLVAGIAYTTYFRSLSPRNLAYFFIIAVVVVATREAGMRLILHWMDGYMETRLSWEGTLMTMFGAAISAITPLGFILLFPLYSELDMKKYEQWGKNIDSMWAKKQFWVRGVGVLGMIFAGYSAYSLQVPELAHAYALFSAFQLMPFDYHAIPTDALDGAFILRWSGWVWMIEMGLALVLASLTL